MSWRICGWIKASVNPTEAVVGRERERRIDGLSVGICDAKWVDGELDCGMISKIAAMYRLSDFRLETPGCLSVFCGLWNHRFEKNIQNRKHRNQRLAIVHLSKAQHVIRHQSLFDFESNISTQWHRKPTSCFTYRPEFRNVPSQVLGDRHHLVDYCIRLDLIQHSVAVGVVKSKHDWNHINYYDEFQLNHSQSIQLWHEIK